MEETTMELKVLAVGDVVGEPGLERVRKSLRKLKRAFSKWEYGLQGNKAGQKGTACTAWNALYLENHDHPRVVSRYGNLHFWRASATMLAASYIFQRGTPFLYQGQELGMTNIALDSIDQYLDVASKNAYNTFHLREPVEKRLRRIQISTRDSARTPVQWNSGPGAGFTSGTPWFTINPNYVKVNAQDQEKKPYSILNFYRSCLALRKSEETLLRGTYREYFHMHPKLFMYERRYKGEVILVVCSFSDKPLSWKLPRRLSRKAPAGYEAELLLANYPRTRDQKTGKKPRGKEGRERHMVKTAQMCRPLGPYEVQVWKMPAR